MEGTKLELTAQPPSVDPPASYKALPEADMEDAAASRPRSALKSKPTSPEVDGADEKMLPKEDEVKVSSNDKQNGDAKLDIGELKTAFVGLTKDELMKYANDPFWVRLRWFLFITFWLLWGLMLLGAVMIILAAPKCNPPPPRTWWEKGPLAEIPQYSEGDVDALKELGVSGVIITWPDDSYGDFDETHDFIKLVKKYKEEGIHVVIELQPGLSDVWFNQSQDAQSEYGSFYIWQAPKQMSNREYPQPPNNWVTVRNTSAWIYSSLRQEFYYAPTGSPQLNLRNPNVTRHFSETIKKFLSLGVGGVQLRGAPSLLVDARFIDESHVKHPGDCVVKDYCFYSHTQTENLKDLAPLLKRWRDVVKNNTENGPFMIREELSTNIEAYKLNSSYVVDLPLQAHLFHKAAVNVTSLLGAVNTVFSANNFTWPLWKVNSTSEWDLVTYLLPGAPLITSSALANKDLLKVRAMPSIMRGDFHAYVLNNDTIFAFTRVTAGNPGILVALNPTENRTTVNFPAHIKAISEDVTVLLYSSNFNETDIGINIKHQANSVPISPKSAIVLSYVPKAD